MSQKPGKKVIGIDLGTTTVVSVMEGSGVIVNQRSRLTPSIVAFAPNRRRLVGQVAKSGSD